MTHEWNIIIHQAIQNQKNKIDNVLVTLVALEGSSYRKPGVRMLLSSDGKFTGAISGGCVEKEVQRRAESVFINKKPKVITYDGRYRLGCEGILYILLEPIQLSSIFIQTFIFNEKERTAFTIKSFFEKEDNAQGNFGSKVCLGEKTYLLRNTWEIKNNTAIMCFDQKMEPVFRLLILGGEHDANKLCKQAAFLGWEVTVITSIKNPKELKDFPGAKSVLSQTPEQIDNQKINKDTAIVIMNHNFSYDLQYLSVLLSKNPIYIGVLGAAKRREKLFQELIEMYPDLDTEFLDRIHSPAGMQIGAITPEEIALSIVAEILSIKRKKNNFYLKEITGSLHA